MADGAVRHRTATDRPALRILAALVIGAVFHFNPLFEAPARLYTTQRSMTECLTITPASIVPWHTLDPRAPKDLTGWAIVPQKKEPQLLNPVELEERLR